MNNNNEDFDLLKKLDENINQPDKFAEVFCNAAAKQVQIRATLKTLLLDIVKTDDGARDELKKICRNTLIESIIQACKNIWLIIFSIVSLVLNIIQYFNK